MEKPIFIEKLYALIFLCLGGAFIFMGLLCFAGIVKPTSHSTVQDPIALGVVFSLLGVVFCMVQTGLRLMNAAKDKLHHKLLASGTKLEGAVEKVYLQKYTQYGKKSPYRVCYIYTHQGERYHRKSYLLWNKPNLNEGDSIMVYAGDLGKSTIQL